MGRRIRVATLSMHQGYRWPKTAEDNLAYVAGAVEEMAAVQPHLIALPEIYATAGLSGEAQAGPQNADLICELARRYKTHIMGSLYEDRPEGRFNTAVVVDPSGGIVGRYDKIHPTEGEIAKGILPGAEGQAPIRLPFGVIGAQICFDANWPRGWQEQAALGAEMIVFPSAYPGGRQLEAYALQNSVYIVASVWETCSGIIDNIGRWITRSDRFANWVWAEVELDRTVFHWDNQGHRIKDIFKRYGPRIKAEYHRPEALFTLEPLDPDLSMREVIQEFGLVTYRDYIARATAAQDAARPAGA